METEEKKRRTYPGWLVDLVERSGLPASELKAIIELYDELEDRPTVEEYRQLQLQNQIIRSHYSESVDLLERIVTAQKEGDLKRANRLEKRYQAMRPRSPKHLSQCPFTGQKL